MSEAAKPETVPVEIKHWLDGRVLYTAAVDVSIAPWFRIKAAVEIAVANRASLVGASLVGARLDGARLVGASLVGASLDGASLVGASLVGARLVGASLVGARLDGARLVGASLVGASLDGASLVGASLDGARLDGARLDGARLGTYTIKSCIARATRSDGYEFIAWDTDKGVIIKAGCQTKKGTDAYRKHVATYTSRHNGVALAAETLAILDFFDARSAHVAPAKVEAA